MNAPPVPRLNLAPQLNRPLSLWNPLDYARLLYWTFFFPQALRWYVKQFEKPEYQEGHLVVWQTLRNDPILRRLILQAVISPFLATGSIAWMLQSLGTPISWPSVAAGVVDGMVVGLAFGVAASLGLGLTGGTALPPRQRATPADLTGGVAAIVAFTAADGVVFGVTVSTAAGVASAIATGLVSGVTAGMAFGALCGGFLGMLFGIASNVVLGVTGGVAAGLASDMAFGVVGGAMGGVASVIAFGLAFGLRNGVAVGVTGGVAFSLTACVMIGRLLDWLLIRLSRNVERGIRMVWLPLRDWQRRLEDWLERDWTTGLHNVNQVLAFTLQFIPAVDAVNAALARSPDDQLLARATALTDQPFDWELLHFNATDLRNRLWQSAIDRLGLQRWKQRWQARFPTELRLNTPARAACAGFWFWHTQKTEQAVAAFAVVRGLRHGPELYGTAQAIFAGKRVTDLGHLAAWEIETYWLEELADPELRPSTLAALRTLRTVAAEASLAHEAFAPLNRSAALGRANATLTRFIETVETTCPYPEWPLIKQIAIKWRDLVSLAGGIIGEEILRQPTPNPYEGYSGLPVTGPTFIGRGDILRKIETRWATGELLPPLILYGHRRMGKSSILRNLAYYAGPGTLLVYLDMQDAGWVDHTGQLLLDLAEAIHRAATKARLDTGPSPADVDYANLGTARRALNALLDRLDPQMRKKRLVLAVDEFELIEENIHSGRIDAGLLPYLRAINQRYSWLALIFAGLHTLDEMGRDYRSAFYGQAEHLRVGYLSYDDALHLITQPHPDFALEYAPDLREELYRLTFGQPYLLQRLCWELVNRWNERFLKMGESIPRTLTLDDLTPVLTPDFYRGAGYYFDGVWSNVTETERALMNVLARRLERPWTIAELATVTGESSEIIQATLELLHRHDVIVRESDGIRFASELMQRWVAKSHS